MTTMHHHHNSRPSPLEIQQLAQFDASLGEVSDGEARRKRILYLKDAVQQMNVGKNLLKGFGCFVIPFAIVPLFWPFLFFFWFMRKKTVEHMNAQLDSALQYWGIQREELQLPPA